MTAKSHDLLLVIDFQNVYLPGQPWACPASPKAIGNIQRILDRAARPQESENPASIDVMFTRFIAPEQPAGTWRTYNKVNQKVNENEWLNELVDPFQSLVRDANDLSGSEKSAAAPTLTVTPPYPVYDKSTYSSLTVSEIRRAAAKADRLVLTGVVAECCVLATAFHAIDLGLPVIYLTDAVAGLDEPKEKASELMLRGLEPVQVRLMTTEDYLNGKEF